ncbi:hypothetical protein SAMN05216299_105104 [Nitrosospira sp. Nsp14]|nr:hypothetical protein SAMN05216299_105104 [Nitrosospira sp. Nsp14]
MKRKRIIFTSECMLANRGSTISRVQCGEFSPWGRVVQLQVPTITLTRSGPNQTSNGIGIYKFASPKVSSGLNTGSWSPVGCVASGPPCQGFLPGTLFPSSRTVYNPHIRSPGTAPIPTRGTTNI